MAARAACLCGQDARRNSKARGGVCAGRSGAASGMEGKAAAQNPQGRCAPNDNCISSIADGAWPRQCRTAAGEGTRRVRGGMPRAHVLDAVAVQDAHTVLATHAMLAAHTLLAAVAMQGTHAVLAEHAMQGTTMPCWPQLSCKPRMPCWPQLSCKLHMPRKARMPSKIHVSGLPQIPCKEHPCRASCTCRAWHTCRAGRRCRASRRYLSCHGATVPRLPQFAKTPIRHTEGGLYDSKSCMHRQSRAVLFYGQERRRRRSGAT